MNRLAYRIRERKHHERESLLNRYMIWICIAGVLLAVGLTWARELTRRDCYIPGTNGEIGQWRHVDGEEMGCVRK